MAHLLEKKGETLRFSRSYRASMDRIEGITFVVPPIDRQNDVVAKVIRIEKEISKLEDNLQKVSSEKEKIIKSFLN